MVKMAMFNAEWTSGLKAGFLRNFESPHGVATQKADFDVFTAVITSNICHAFGKVVRESPLTNAEQHCDLSLSWSIFYSFHGLYHSQLVQHRHVTEDMIPSGLH